MAKFNKILLGAALAGAAAAGGLAYFLTRKEKETSWEDDLEDFDDNLSFDDEEENDENEEPKAPISREYVTIPTENHAVSESLKDAPEAGLENSPVAENLKAAMEQVASRVASEDMEELKETEETEESKTPM